MVWFGSTDRHVRAHTRTCAYTRTHTDLIPFGNHPLYRYLLGWLGAPKVSFIKKTMTPQIRREVNSFDCDAAGICRYDSRLPNAIAFFLNPPRQVVYKHVVQDIIIPIDEMSRSIDLFHEWFEVCGARFPPPLCLGLVVMYSSRTPVFHTPKPGVSAPGLPHRHLRARARGLPTQPQGPDPRHPEAGKVAGVVRGRLAVRSRPHWLTHQSSMRTQHRCSSTSASTACRRR